MAFQSSTTQVSPVAQPPHIDNATSIRIDKLLYSSNDATDMHRMGKKPQLRRNLPKFSSMSMICVMVATWEYLFIANDQGLVDGGLAGLFWSYVWTLVGFALITASLSEMASMAPTDGGMYHWVSEFAPRGYQRFLSYIAGWMSTLSWQAGNASAALVTGLLIQAILTVNNLSYNPTRWQGTLFVFATVLLVWFINSFLIKFYPVLQNLLLFLHISAFFVVVIILWVKAPLNSAKDVFTTFTNGGGWSSTGLSLMIGQITVIYCLVGSDAAAHMAEETQDAGISVPFALLWSFGLNGIMGLIFLITMLFTITSIDDALSDPSGYPAIWILKQAFPHSNAGVTTMVAIIIVIVLVGNVSLNCSTSRQMFAFARDGGLPFSRWICHVHPRLMIPLNAISLTSIITCLAAIINIGSDVAFNAIISLFLVALMFAYILCIACVLYRRLAWGEKSLPSARWKMGHKTGVAVNTGAVLYSSFAFFWCFWPNTTATGLTNFNWAVVVFLAVFIFAVLAYIVEGRKTYVSPVSTVADRSDIRS